MKKSRQYRGQFNLNNEIDRLWEEINRLNERLIKGEVKQTTKQFRSINTQGLQNGILVAIVDNVLQRADYRRHQAEWVVVEIGNGSTSAESCADAHVKTMGKNNIEAGDPLFLATDGKCAKEKTTGSGQFLQQIGVAAERERNGSVYAKVHIHLTHIVG